MAVVTEERSRQDGRLLRAGVAVSGFYVPAQASAGDDRVGFKGQDGAYTKNSDREEYI